jgi:hypothetical protein
MNSYIKSCTFLALAFPAALAAEPTDEQSLNKPEVSKNTAIPVETVVPAPTMIPPQNKSVKVADLEMKAYLRYNHPYPSYPSSQEYFDRRRPALPYLSIIPETGHSNPQPLLESEGPIRSQPTNPANLKQK